MPEENTNTGGQNAGSTGTQSQSSSSGQTSTGSQGTESQTQTGTNAGDKGTQPGTQSGTNTGGTNTGGTETQTGGTQTQTQTPDWPADWRQKLVGAEDKDGKVLKQLERFASPGDLLKSYNELRTQVDSGQFKKPLPKDATPEQLSAYRKENGIPETADQYDLTLPDGLIIGDKDKAILKPILAEMHGANLTPDQVKTAIAAYKKQEAQFLVAQTQRIDAAKQENNDALHREWGDEFRPEINRIEALLATYSPETQEALQLGTDANGLPFLNNLHVMRDLAVQARIINPVTTITPNGGTSTLASVETEIAQIEAKIGGTKEERDAYFKDEKMQARYRDLLQYKENQKQGGRAA